MICYIQSQDIETLQKELNNESCKVPKRLTSKKGERKIGKKEKERKQR